jgi:hypothetical protein
MDYRPFCAFTELLIALDITVASGILVKIRKEVKIWEIRKNGDSEMRDFPNPIPVKQKWRGKREKKKLIAGMTACF